MTRSEEPTAETTVQVGTLRKPKPTVHDKGDWYVMPVATGNVKRIEQLSVRRCVPVKRKV